MTGFAVVSTTVEREEEARSLAQALVEDRLVACVQILPIRSIYNWQGQTEDTAEYLLLCKIAACDFAAVEAAIRRRHSYDVPEIVMTAIAAGYTPYLDWIADRTTRKTQSGGSR